MSEPIEDAIWVARCLRGDSAAFEPLVTRYQRLLFTVALRIVGDYEDARDATQSAFLRAYQGLGTYDPERKFFSWIYRIVVNECLNICRARKSWEPLTGTLEAKGGLGDELEASERHDRLQAALMRLSLPYREVVVLRYFAELSYREISEAVGVPEKTVKSRLFTARQELGQLLRGDERTKS